MEISNDDEKNVNNIIQTYFDLCSENKSKSFIYEFEIRFDKKDNKNKFNPILTEKQYKKLLDFFQELDECIHVSTKKQYKLYDNNGNIKIENINYATNDLENCEYMKKENVKKYDIDNYGIRMSISKEKYIEEKEFSQKNIKYEKSRVRYEFLYKNMYIHLSKFNVNNNVVLEYDCEIEMIKPDTTNKQNIFELS